DRLRAAPGVVGSVVAGSLVLHALGAPHELLALEGAMVLTLGCVGALTSVWKVSFHTAAACASLIILTTVQGAWFHAVLPLTALIGWSRVRLGAHTPAQGVVGAVLGGALGGVGFLLLR
ncbi:phosphatase PAP2 family protein, partial [Streptomyces venezuelae]